MSICALTSKGQDPAEWTNYFNGGALQIPENAELCVIGGSVQRNNKTDDNIVVNEENNCFVLHYGTSSAAVVDNLYRDDEIILTNGTYSVAEFLTMAEACLNDQVTNSCLATDAWTVTLNAQNQLKMAAELCEVRAMTKGNWVPAGGINASNEIDTQTAPASTTFTPPAAGPVRKCWYVDNQALFNNWNQGTAADGVNNLEGASWNITAAGANPNSNNLQGGIVVGTHKTPENEYTPRVTWSGLGNNSIDIGWEIKGRSLLFFHHKLTPKGEGGANGIMTREKIYDGNPINIVANTTIGMRYLKDGNDITQIQTFYNIGGLNIQGAIVSFTDETGDFGMGKYAGNGKGRGAGHYMCLSFAPGNNCRVRCQGAYHDEGTALAVATDYFNNVQFAFSKLENQVAAIGDINLSYLKKIEQYANIGLTLGFNEGSLYDVAQSYTNGVVSTAAIANWDEAVSPIAVQFLDMGINGYLGGGIDAIGGANECPLVAIIDSFQQNDILPIPLPRVWETSQSNWVQLKNAAPLSLNQFRVRLTDMTGRKIENLAGDSSIWFKVRKSAKSSSAFKMPGESMNGNNPNEWIKRLHD